MSFGKWLGMVKVMARGNKLSCFC